MCWGAMLTRKHSVTQYFRVSTNFLHADSEIFFWIRVVKFMLPIHIILEICGLKSVVSFNFALSALHVKQCVKSCEPRPLPVVSDSGHWGWPLLATKSSKYGSTIEQATYLSIAYLPCILTKQTMYSGTSFAACMHGRQAHGGLVSVELNH